MKRIFDLILSIFLLVLFSPVMLLVSGLVLCGMGRPVLFCQTRPGYQGKTFKVYKFRTMTNGRDEMGNLLPDQDRLIRLGKLMRNFSLDELPQLWNVLKGDMSFVGPRPLLMEYLPLYTKEQARRHEVKPGIGTGWRLSPVTMTPEN